MIQASDPSNITVTIIALTHCSDEFGIEFPCEQWLRELSEKSTNCCGHCMYTAALQTGILWICDEREQHVVS